MARLLAAALVTLLTACSLPLSAPPAELTHTLSLPPQAVIPRAVPPGRTVLVAAPSAAPGYTTSAMAYRPSAHELRYYAHQRWVDRPARLLGQALVDGFLAGGAQVVADGSGARPDYRLLTELVQLEQDFNVQPSRLRLALRVQLVDVRDGRLLGSDTLRLEQAAATDDPAGGVAAANALLERAVAGAARFCQRLTAQP